jgi:hypothetical protein
MNAQGEALAPAGRPRSQVMTADALVLMAHRICRRYVIKSKDCTEVNARLPRGHDISTGAAMAAAAAERRYISAVVEKRRFYQQH